MLFLHASVSLLWQPIQVNPALENTCSTGVNDAGMQSRFMA